MASPNMNMDSEVGAQFVALPDGRRIAYREQGLSRKIAKKSLLVLHGLGCSRVAGMPGVSESLLEEMGVRIVSIDRPGYGLSDFNPSQTWKSFCQDLVHVADSLELGEKIWLLGYSCGGAYCWAAARYIPERIAGIAMWAPAGNFYWKGISKTERNKIIGALNFRTRSTYGIIRKVPVQLQWMCYAYVRYLCVPAVGNRWVEDAKNMLSAPDAQNLEQFSGAFMARDTIESAKQGGKGMAQDAILVCSDWGFELSDVRDRYQGSIHIFNGDQDLMVPLGLQRCIKGMLPDHVHLHHVEGEGHISAFCYNDKIHRKTLECLFGGVETTGKVDESQLFMRLEEQAQVKGGSIISETVKGPLTLNAPYRIFITVCILALFKLSIVV
ncbi:hypothetical protein KC19_2G228000 [Ceratodon purpureus]|uniref:AB hydrolase-1 domain-containing protein n=1 Tax=Ceratodon purpureus TaxID=3225 RepID=A0A8T0IZC1_CERPU|nr:hypothetical protein KC19_2G228000 [Ceratodon purpureus]KAG0588239.1 hypothetical protein KC19_2G228000 [Ceratodon purpureus]KAG0588240.1 hypothetical protein KC19_2G228000 [Ceratodon purpureus]